MGVGLSDAPYATKLLANPIMQCNIVPHEYYKNSYLPLSPRTKETKYFLKSF